ncbi:Arc family DNA-binding protein [Marinobacter sp. OP 3.4]|uniref:Arc family DNA-binding protein n=1 Tax=Marinobacter sp. OP 3.4 TaxID=3076501 RepID=UPI002E21FDFE
MSEKSYPSHQLDKFQLRLPAGMREQIREAAERNSRSMNSEIVARLEQSFAGPKELEAAAGVSQRLEEQLQQVRMELSLMAKANAEASEFIRELREMDRRKEEG